MSSFDDFPGLFEADRRIEQAVDVLETARKQLRPPTNGEDWAPIAQRLRGAAMLAHTASVQLAVVSGWNEAARAAADAGALDGEERGRQ